MNIKMFSSARKKEELTLDKKYGLYNFNNLRGYSYQIFAFTLLGFSTTSISVLLICLCARATAIKAILIAMIFALPLLGIGLNFKTFNDTSLKENGEIIYDAGYLSFGIL